MNAVIATTSRMVTAGKLSEPLYKCLQSIVGGYIEIVRPRGLPHPFCMIVDEEGRLKQKALNEIGSALYQVSLHKEPIVGDIAIIKEVETEEGPDLSGLDESDVAYVLKIIETQCVGKEEHQVDG